MYRQDFVDGITTWCELLDFCYENDCDSCADIETADSYSDWIDNNLVSWARNDTWQDLLERLRDLENNDGYDYYVWDDYDSVYRPADDRDFETYKGYVLTWGDEEGIWEDYEEDDEEDETEIDSEDVVDVDDDFQIPDEDVSFGDLFTAGVSCIRAIDEEEVKQAREQDMAFAEFNKVICRR